MPSDSEQEDYEIDWNSLKTITTFDGCTEDRKLIKSESKNNKSTTDRTAAGSTQLISENFFDSLAIKASTPVSLLVESLVQQLCIMLDPDPLKSTQLYHTICEQLHAMNLIDKTYAMGEFEVMRSEYQKALYQLVSVARGQDLPKTLQTVWPLTQPIGMDWSRYHREFDELGFIAGGGFGKVFKAKHKLDGNDYAVKKITIKSVTINSVLSHLAEVRTLASLNNPNIVPYKAAWLEPLLTDPNVSPSNNATADQSITEQDETEESYAEQISVSQTYRSNKTNNRSDESSDFIEFKESARSSCNQSHLSLATEQSQSEQNEHRAIIKFENKNINFDNSQPHLSLKWATLYIQMSLCQLTLRQWLDRRNKCDTFEHFYREFFDFCDNKVQFNEPSNQNTRHPVIVLDILKQLINGLNYIHERGIIHHDIKPSNIFIDLESDGRLSILLGDFGLACPLQDEHTKIIVGTPTYAAPEQLAGVCDVKSDIYSLGIILLELLLKFNTDMERIKTIENTRKGQLPANIPDNFSQLLHKLLQPTTTQRPNTKQILDLVNRLIMDTDSINTETKVTADLTDELRELRGKLEVRELIDEEVRSKNEEIKLKNEEIAILKSKISTLQRRGECELKTKDDEISRLRKLLRNSLSSTELAELSQDEN